MVIKKLSCQHFRIKQLLKLVQDLDQLMLRYETITHKQMKNRRIV